MAVTKTPLATEVVHRSAADVPSGNGTSVITQPRRVNDRGGAPPDGTNGRGRGLPPAEPARSPVAWRLGVGLALAAVTMMFIGFTSAYLVRRQAPDWTGTGPLPPLLWLNTLLLLGSSVVLELGRRAGGPQGVRRGLTGAVLLGVLFVAGQLAVWRRLVAMSVYLASSPHSSFFYVLTGAHALHVLIAMAWLAYAAWRVARDGGQAAGAPAWGQSWRSAAPVAGHQRSWRAGEPTMGTGSDLAGMVAAAATFWHFMAGLWIFLFALLFAL